MARIGIDASCWINGRGYGRFTRGLVRALLAERAACRAGHEFVLILDRATAERADLPPDIPLAIAEGQAAATQAASSSGRRSLGDLLAMRDAAARAGLDLLLYPSVYTWFPPPRGVPTIVTIHDAIPERYPRFVFPNRRLEFFWRAKTLTAAHGAARVLTVSRDAARDIARTLRVPAGRIRVVGEGIEGHFRPAAPGEEPGRTGGPTLLYVGGLSPHKNLAALIEAVARLRRDREFAELRLDLIGDVAGDSFFSAHDNLRSLTLARGLGEVVRFLGFVPDDALARHYRAATALVLPSLIEGFGLPAVEALACGTPVVASTAGSLPEVVGEAGVFFDPGDAAGLDWALRRVLSDAGLRAELSRRGVARAARYEWPRAARATLAACDEVLATRGARGAALSGG